jgi:ribosome-associated protein
MGLAVNKADLVVNEQLIIPSSEIEWRAVRSGGPGGQNVNKVATKVVLCFDPRSPSLPLAVSQRLCRLAAGRLDAEGRICVACETTRSQARNLALARELLTEIIRAALVAPKRRRATRPSATVSRLRVEGKRRTGAKKQARSRGSWE